MSEHEHEHEEAGHLQFFASPLKHGSGAKSHTSSEDYEAVQTETIDIPNTNDRKLGREVSNAPSYINNDRALHEIPDYHRHAEATSGELFYDLFFVANLTTFTNNHEINSQEALASYVGFFAVLWLTWYQVSLHDVRFSVDSVFDRLCKAAQFGVMTGFAVSGPQFLPNKIFQYAHAFQTFSLLLMASRFVLAVQYAHAFFYLRGYRKARIPFAIIIGTEVIAAFCYLGTYFAFPFDPELEGAKNHAYVAYYVVGFTEVLINTVVSCVFRDTVSFKGTHIVERMSLLTLIILGEGVIGITKAIAAIIDSNTLFSNATRDNIACAVLILYSLYMIYFDRIRNSTFGTIRTQLWAFLHFPLHVALVLTTEGIAQFMTWKPAVEDLYQFEDMTANITEINSTMTESYYHQLAGYLNYTTTFFLYGISETVNVDEIKADINETLTQLYDGATLQGNGTNFNATIINNLLDDYYTSMFELILKEVGIQGEAKEGASADDQLNADFTLIDLVYVYLFVAAGLALIIMGIMAWTSRHPATWRQWVRGSINFAVGLGLAFLSTMDLTNNVGTFAVSDYVIPTVFLSLAVVLIGDHMPLHKFWVRK